MNTLIVASVTSLLATVFGFLSAYSFTRFRYRGSTFLPLFYLVVRMVPRISLVLPFYVILSQVHMLNTKTALILSYTTFALPFGIWMMIGFLKELPIDLEEAAAVDGASRWQILAKVVIPLAAPGLATTAIFAFLLGWNEFLFSLILGGTESRTLPVMVAGFETDRGIRWGQLSAAAVSIMLPVVAVALVLQRHIVRGLTLGAVKVDRSARAVWRTLGLDEVRLEGGFWAGRQAVNREAALPHGLRMLEEAGNLDNLRIVAGRSDRSYRGPYYMDSDIYKWLEAA